MIKAPRFVGLLVATFLLCDVASGNPVELASEGAGRRPSTATRQQATTIEDVAKALRQTRQFTLMDRVLPVDSRVSRDYSNDEQELRYTGQQREQPVKLNRTSSSSSNQDVYTEVRALRDLLIEYKIANIGLANRLHRVEDKLRDIELLPPSPNTEMDNSAPNQWIAGTVGRPNPPNAVRDPSKVLITIAMDTNGRVDYHQSSTDTTEIPPGIMNDNMDKWFHRQETGHGRG